MSLRSYQIHTVQAIMASLIIVGLFAVCGCGNPQKNPATPIHVSDIKPLEGFMQDVTLSAGIDYKLSIEGKKPLNILQTVGNGCAFLDYNNDGNLDILLIGSKIALYQGDGKGHFTDVSKQTGLDKLSGHFLGCAVGDYDNDGYDDIYISAYRGGLLLHNEQGKSFADVTKKAALPAQPWGTSCSFTDIDGDGKLDLFVGNYVQFGPNTSPQLCEYSGHMSACGPRFYKPEFSSLYRNLGGGKFQDITKKWLLDSKGQPLSTGKVLGVAAADYKSNGKQSIALSNDEMAGDLMLNSSGSFENVGAKSGTAYDSHGNVHGGMGVDWGDYDNDGKLDLLVATFQHEAKCLYHNDGVDFTESSAQVGLAEKSTSYVAFGVKFLDYDNDGFLDIALANGHVQDNINLIDKSTSYEQKPQLFHNIGGTAFEEVSDKAGITFQKKIVGRGLAIGDFDNDGRVDLLYIDSQTGPILLHNQSPNVGHWLLCRLEGTKSNRDGIGALVTFEVSGKKYLRNCATDGSYLSASDRRVHIGMGSSTSADITVKWPSGGTSTYKNVSSDRVVTLKEGETSAR